MEASASQNYAMRRGPPPPRKPVCESPDGADKRHFTYLLRFWGSGFRVFPSEAADTQGVVVQRGEVYGEVEAPSPGPITDQKGLKPPNSRTSKPLP